MSDQKWTVEKIHKEVADAKTKLFVVTKVLETGEPKLSDQPEWAILIAPLLKDLKENADRIQAMLDAPKAAEPTE